MNVAQGQWIERIQERLHVTSIFLDDIKAVKMQGLTKALTSAIRDLRSDEIETSTAFRRLLIAVILLCQCRLLLHTVDLDADWTPSYHSDEPRSRRDLRCIRRHLVLERPDPLNSPSVHLYRACVLADDSSRCVYPDAAQSGPMHWMFRSH